MDTHEKETFMSTYDWANEWTTLPWSHAEPTLFLSEICRLRIPGKALDIGCGAGTDSVFLAQQGWDVTSLDFVPKALEFTQQRAEKAGVSVTAVEADITQWEPSTQFDLVLDHGLLHNMDPVRYSAYRDCVLKALAPDADFILLHWHPLFKNQADGKMGPTRVDRKEIKSFFAPELQERFFAREEFEDLTSMVGGGMVQAYYWFRPNQAYHQPTKLLEQIESSLSRHNIDFENLIKTNIPNDVSDDLLKVMLGPGRFGIHHEEISDSQIAEILMKFASSAGRKVEHVEKLLKIFASEDAGSICSENARCDVCDVSFCKRLRYAK
ncbi:MAG: class I SAM-dependent methyltransferase [Pseudomonadota bacterium]|nr:class I SAM-dependent methyltransferase [Pseudomonadota bacterium]